MAPDVPDDDRLPAEVDGVERLGRYVNLRFQIPARGEQERPLGLVQIEIFQELELGLDVRHLE